MPSQSVCARHRASSTSVALMAGADSLTAIHEESGLECPEREARESALPKVVTKFARNGCVLDV
jgi:hypothetical protein